MYLESYHTWTNVVLKYTIKLDFLVIHKFDRSFWHYKTYTKSQIDIAKRKGITVTVIIFVYVLLVFWYFLYTLYLALKNLPGENNTKADLWINSVLIPKTFRNYHLFKELKIITNLGGILYIFAFSCGSSLRMIMQKLVNQDLEHWN